MRFVRIFDIIFLFATKFEKPKIGMSGKGLTESVISIRPYDLNLKVRQLLIG